MLFSVHACVPKGWSSKVKVDCARIVLLKNRKQNNKAKEFNRFFIFTPDNNE
jgi:hypothetical protein